MNALQIILPISVLVLSTLLKLFIDRTISLPVFIETILEIPVNVIFLSISLMTGYTISGAINNPSNGICSILIQICIAIINILLWRRSRSRFDKQHFKMMVVYLSINYFISIYSFIQILLIITGGENAIIQL